MSTYHVTYADDDGVKDFGNIEADSGEAAIVQVVKSKFWDRSKEDRKFLADNMTAKEVKDAPVKKNAK